MNGRLRKSALAGLVALSAGAFAATDASAQSRRDCDAYARDYANSHARTPGNVAGGAVAGAIIGGIIGSQSADAGKGAAIGAGVGATAGAGKSSVDWNRAYRSAYRDCRDDRREARAVRHRSPEPWTREWRRYCADKYRTFNPRTGYYMSTSGRRFCR